MVTSSLDNIISGMNRERESTKKMGKVLSSAVQLYIKSEKQNSKIEGQSKSSDSDGEQTTSVNDSTWSSNPMVDLFTYVMRGKKIEGAVIAGKLSGEGTFLGLVTAGTVSGSIFKGSIKSKQKATWNPQKGEAGAEAAIEAEGQLLSGKAEGNIGFLNGKVAGSVGNVGATGAVGVSLFKDGKLSPELKAKAKAEASVLTGEGEATFGNSEYNAHAKASGKVLAAEAEAKAGIGKITSTDEAGNTTTNYGVEGKVSAEAYLASGKVSGGLTIFGINIDGSISGKAGGIGVGAGGAVTTGGVKGEIGAGLGLGAGLEINIDWSNFSLW